MTVKEFLNSNLIHAMGDDSLMIKYTFTNRVVLGFHQSTSKEMVRDFPDRSIASWNYSTENSTIAMCLI